MTASELLLQRAAYYRDLARRARLQIDVLADGDAARERIARYLDTLDARALAWEKQAAALNC
jgi:hypothetical protein